MPIPNWKPLALACAAAATLCACASHPGVPGTATRTELSYSTGRPPLQAAESAVANVVAGSGPDTLRTLGIVYFDFDRYDVKPKYQDLLMRQARDLRAHPDAHAVIEGHTDPFGSQEYNLALGQRRADAVRHALTLLGVPEAQLETVSFGETRLAVPGEDAASRALDRRAEIRAPR